MWNTEKQVVLPSSQCPRILKTEGWEKSKQGESTSKRGRSRKPSWQKQPCSPSQELAGRTHLYAARATAVDTTVLRVSFPPKPPPILFTRTKIRFAGTPSIFATKLYGPKKKKKKLLALECIIWTSFKPELEPAQHP